MKKPELLLPAGSPEALSAAFENGADAVYLGLASFSARNRAKNFTPFQLKSGTRYAHSLGKKLYVTINTILKNSELGELLDLLNVAADAGVDGVIIQDWGVYRLIRKHFPSLKIHGSTQMGCHNSAGVSFAAEMHFSRMILSRELTTAEMKAVAEKSRIELEVFIHGALCYSFSGYCLFSSYLGGMSANRGQCRQPCRRLYTPLPDGMPQASFSMKDLQLVELLPELQQAGIASLKIEGRMKPAEYAARTAAAYRLALDEPDRLPEVLQMLQKDMGREKTAWFYDRKVAESISSLQFTGSYLGRIQDADQRAGTVSLLLEASLHRGDRIRVQTADGRDSKPVKVVSLLVDGTDSESASSGQVAVVEGVHSGRPGDPVYLTAVTGSRFDTRFASEKVSLPKRFTAGTKEKMLSVPHRKGKQELHISVRIDSVSWLPKCRFDRVQRVILRLGKSELQEFDPSRPMIQKFKRQLVLELPLFIPEEQIPFFRETALKLYRSGITVFCVSHFSQLEIIPREAAWFASEQFYVMNDQTAAYLRELGAESFCYSMENDMSNLFSMRDKSGIVPVYAKPALFHSRMPVLHNNAEIADETGAYQVIKRDGMTTVVPERAFSLTAHVDKIREKGFHSFLIDFSCQKPGNSLFQSVLNHFIESEPLHGTLLFNWKNGLK